MAAGRKFNIEMILGAKDKASAKLRKIKLAVVAVGAASIAFAVKAVQAAAVQERAENALASALSTHGDEVDKLLPKFKALAASIQQQTIYGDEFVISMMAQIRNMGVMPDQMEKATKGAIGLAKALNLDADAAAKYTALALQGEVTILQRYIPALRSATSMVEKQRIVTELMNRGYEQAQLETETFSGALIQLKNTLGDLMEKAGFILLPSLREFVIFLNTDVEQAFSSFIDIIKQVKKNTDRAAESTIKFLDEIKKTPFMEKWGETIAKAAKAGLNFSGIFSIATDAVNSLTVAVVEKAGIVIESSITEVEAIEQAESRKIEAVIQANLVMTDAERTRQAELKKIFDKAREEEKRRLKQKREDFKSTLEYISSLAYSNNKTLAAIGRTTAIAVATIDTYVAANKAFASTVPPFNYILMAAVIAAGLANVNRIKGVSIKELERGGIVQKTGLAIVHEGEIFSGTRNQMGFGRGITNVFTGNYIMNDRSMSDFAEMVSIKQMRMLQIEKNF